MKFYGIQFIITTATFYRFKTILKVDVGGQRCPNSVRIYCAVSVSQNLEFSAGRVIECSDFEFELDFDRQTPDIRTALSADV